MSLFCVTASHYTDIKAYNATIASAKSAADVTTYAKSVHSTECAAYSQAIRPALTATVATALLPAIGSSHMPALQSSQHAAQRTADQPP